MTIYAMFSVANNYDQPDHNLVIYWNAKPSIQEVAQVFGLELKYTTEDITILNIVSLWQGHSVRWSDDTDYQIREVKPNVRVDRQKDEPAKKQKG